MGLISISRANCKNCYKCVRYCPVKSIRIKNNQANVEKDLCINCGICIKQCPQGAKRVKGGLDNIKGFIEGKEKVIASIAPSFGALFPMPFNDLKNKLLEMGFYHVEETAVAAELIAVEYNKLLENQAENTFLISSTCSVVKSIIEKYYPRIARNLAPVVSPMIAHGRLLKSIYGMDSKVVFIGPCIAKKEEAIDPMVSDAIDEVLTFTELIQWLEESKGWEIPLPRDTDINAVNPKTGRWFPLPGGIFKTAGINVGFEDGDILIVDGIDETITLLKDLEQGRISPKFVEILGCKGGCIGGPAAAKDDSTFEKRNRMVKYAMETLEGNSIEKNYKPITLNRSFKPKAVISPYPGEKTIMEILASIGKTTPDKELNCGSCGYPTCRDKAIAVYQDMAELEMCMPYMRDKAENMANLIIEATPNGIIVVDANMVVMEFNNAAEAMFKIKAGQIKGKPLSTIMDEGPFYDAIETKGYFKIKREFPNYSLMADITLSYIEEENLILAIFVNITDTEQHKKSLKIVRQETLQKAQEVINKQMRVAQEIAGLLGETTAESKVLLTRLIDIVKAGGDDSVS